ncbi:alpha/beta fold hydrolase [Brevundimonas sp.]|uniref:alpha/beta fold hydrolase n=1 Tax=Brevundimonas sp. TaxID=1871086 RepID=UPI003F6F7583
MSARARHNVKISGSGPRPMVFAHGFGCDQHMWRFVAPAFEDAFKVILFDLMGAGGSDLSGYDPARYASLEGFADDLVLVAEELNVRDGVFVGHSVSAMIGLLAARKAPHLFSDLVMIGPSPRYIDDAAAGYTGGFSEGQIHELLDFLDSNHMGWSQAMAPTIMGNPERPELADELTNSFCRTDPEIAKRFARTTFLSDNRDDLDGFDVRTLILQCADDVIAPQCVGEYVHRALPNSELVLMSATGHCPNLSAPEETVAAVQAFVR